jgi:GT2 family glycosyltransferase
MLKCLYIILPVYNRIDTTRDFVKCLIKQTFKNFKLIVIDDGSTDGTFDMIREYFQDAVQIKGKGNWWWGGSLQQGYLWLKKNANAHDIVLFMNDDSKIEPDFLQAGIDLLEKSPRTLLLATAYSLQNNKLVDKGIVFDFEKFNLHMPGPDEKINCMSTRGLFLHVQSLFELKGFRNILLPHYYSDYEFTIRAGRNGFNLLVDEHLKLWMNEETTGTGKIRGDNSFRLLKQYFSKKYTDHPLYTLNFILLTFPYPYKIKYAFRQMMHTLKTIVKLLLKKPVAN